MTGRGEKRGKERRAKALTVRGGGGGWTCE